MAPFLCSEFCYRRRLLAACTCCCARILRMCKVRGPLCCSRCVEDTKRDSKAAEEFSAVGRTNEKQLETRFHDFPSLVNVQASAGNGAAIRPPQQVCSRISPQARRACLRPPCAEQPLCPDQTHLDPKGNYCEIFSHICCHRSRRRSCTDPFYCCLVCGRLFMCW